MNSGIDTSQPKLPSLHLVLAQIAARRVLVNYGNEKDGISPAEPMHTLPTKDWVALVEVVQVPNTLMPEQLVVDPITGVEEWRPINKKDQVRLIGNSLCPDEAEALVSANAANIIELYQRLAT